MDADIWDLFHDGTITSCSGTVPGDLELEVKINYLRKMIEPKGPGFRVGIQGCTLLGLESWADHSVTTDPAALGDVGLLSGSVEGDVVVVICDGYTLRLRYAGIRLAVDDGTPFTIDELKAVAERYWTAFGNRRKEP